MLLYHNPSILLRAGLFILLTIICALTFDHAYAQSKFKVSGRVFDVTKLVPLPSVTVMSTNGLGTTTDSLGQYSIPVSETDSIWFSYLGKPTPKYPVKSIPNINQFELSLHVSVTNLPAVTVKSPNYRMDSIANRREYEKAFNFRKPGLSPSVNPNGGVGADLTELISIFQFRRNKRMAAFRDRLIREEQEKYIDHKFSRPLIVKLTGLKGEELNTFIERYRPELWFINTATDYELGIYIKKCFERYQVSRRNETIIHQQEQPSN